MFYDAHRIQPKGRQIEIGEQTEIFTGEHRQGSRCKTPKNASWKYRSTCQNCGAEFAGRKDGANRFCKNDCQHEFAVSRWFKCSCCLAKIGVGGQTASKILGIVASTSITRQWKARGIVSQKPAPAGWFMAAKQIIAESNAWVENWESAWMEEVKPPRFPDWSDVWRKEKYRIAGNEKYNEAHAVYERSWMAEVRSHGSYKVHPDWRLIAQRRAARTNPKAKTVFNLRRRLRDLIKTSKNGGSKIGSKFIGCSTKQLAAHLESKFTKRMTWENYGAYWHVDHIIPCAAFDHTDPKQRAACWHWTNLQPMEAKANLRKSNKIENAQMSLQLCTNH
jgi:hypothetical protein